MNADFRRPPRRTPAGLPVWSPDSKNLLTSRIGSRKPAHLGRHSIVVNPVSDGKVVTPPGLKASHAALLDPALADLIRLGLGRKDTTPGSARERFGGRPG
jgi:hypothetical protein